MSRKGFDSSNGGAASPIFDDGSAVSLPIPAGRRSPIRFEALSAPGTPYTDDLGTLAAALSRGRVTGHSRCHLDPDLDERSGPPTPDWLAGFGQVGTAQAHLNYEHVGPGDLFLFFGWFRQVEESGETWRYRRGAPSVHRLFGWLQVAERLAIGEEFGDRMKEARERHPGLRRHPHLWGYWDPNNTIFTGRETLELPGAPGGTRGAGLFGNDPSGELILTAADARLRSEWQVPACFKPRGDNRGLTYHRDAERWSEKDGTTRLRAVARGQEFVLDAKTADGAVEWAASLWNER